jgi:hypothetical protein
MRFPATPVCPGHSTPFAAICDAYFGRAPVVVWKASRAFGGKTNAMAALAFAEAVTLQASVTILGGSGEQSARVHEYMDGFWAKPAAPRQALSVDATKTKTRLVWGNTVTALMASYAAVSGPHPQRLRVDEVDLVDLGLLDQALGQPMSTEDVEANVLLSSAHYQPDGTLTEVLKRAAEKGWKVHEWCWRETVEPHGWLRQSEIARQRSVVTKAMWDTQYDLQEPSPEDRAIDPEKVERMFLGAEIPGDGADETFHYREFEAPVEHATYSTGADWARTADYVEIVTWRDDVVPLRLVAYQRFRKVASPLMLARFSRQCERYPGTSANDATGGGVYLQDWLPDGTEGFVMVGQRRRALFNDYILAIEHEELVAPRIRPLYRQHKFCRNKDLWSQSGHPPDGVVASSLAYNASQRATRPLRLSGSRNSDRAHHLQAESHLDIVRGIVRPEGPPPVEESGLRRALNFGSNGNGGNGHGHEQD